MKTRWGMGGLVVLDRPIPEEWWDYPVRLAIVGSAEWDDDGVLAAKANINEALAWYRPGVLVSGGAKGVDTWAVEAAQRRMMRWIERLPSHRRWEPDGFAERNLQVARDCTHLVAIRSRLSKTYGSGWTADRAEEYGKIVERITL